MIDTTDLFFRAYPEKWLKFQALQKLQAEDIAKLEGAKLGGDKRLLAEIAKRVSDRGQEIVPIEAERRAWLDAYYKPKSA